MRVRGPQLFAPVRREVRDQQSATRSEHARAFGEHGGRSLREMQHLVQHHGIGRAVRERERAHIRKPHLGMAKPRRVEPPARQPQHRGAEVQPGRPARARAQQFDHAPGAGADIEQPPDRPRPQRRHNRAFHLGFGHMQRAQAIPFGRVRLEPGIGSGGTFGAHVGQARRIRLGSAHAPRIQPGEYRGDMPALAQRQEHPRAFLVAAHDPRMAEDLHMPRHARLALAEHIGEFADAQLHPPHQRDDAQPRSVGESGVDGERVDHAPGYKDSFKSGQGGVLFPPARPARISRGMSELARLHRAPEPQVLGPLLDAAALDAPTLARVRDRARALIAALRAAEATGWVNAFLREYRLGTQEGIALLGLAEAFLRVPDPETADLLIRDKIGQADWRAHAGASNSALVNSATWGLVLTRALVSEPEKPGILKSLVARAGEPFVRAGVGAAMRRMGEVFVMGRTIPEALSFMRGEPGFTASFDMLGEAARTWPDADRYMASYVDAVRRVGEGGAKTGHSVSVKLSALHPRYETAQASRCVPELSARLIELARGAAAAGIGLTVDAEESERLEMSLDIIAAAARDAGTRGWDGLGMAVQAYSKRARPVIAWADALGGETGRRFNVRLVKGAYWDSEIKRTQVEGLSDYPLFTRKAATDVSYLACARDMLAAKHLFPAFASHNAMTVATILEWAGDNRAFEFQRLHGMGAGLYETLVRERGHHCRIYAPVGGHRDLLAYLVRRLLENGANSSFVHQLADASLSEEELLADPVALVQEVGGTRHPAIPLPGDLFSPERVNSAGLDLADARVLAATAAAVANPSTTGQAGGGPPPRSGGGQANPPRYGDGDHANHGRGDRAAVATAAARAQPWDAPVETRAAAIARWGDLLEAHRAELMRLAVHEARKTIPDALGEVREAVDFCRYYAARLGVDFEPQPLPGPTGEANELRLAPRGLVACISPWNFPLAIFTGQVAAALAAGNAVLAKPAPQTPRIAARAVELAYEAGVPRAALHLLPGGPDVGHAIVAHTRVMLVAFTGSTATARAIARTLLEDETRPLVPLIAETGGLNAMLVDSTALPEQVVQDVVTSAFRSAGQRCSALRLLLLQEDIAERTLEMLNGAMDTLVLGDPADPATDVGPVIDAPAYDRLMIYRESKRARWIHSVTAPPAPAHLVPPTVIRLDRPEDLRQEWFGPLLHVATFRAGDLEATVRRVNASGYGLTMGLHSRVAATADAVTALAHAGNLYINRSMIGAVVGSQPFGGEGLSGTGPKAGGPRYLPRFAVERTVSIDTTSAGGNASLLSIDAGGL